MRDDDCVYQCIDSEEESDYTSNTSPGSELEEWFTGSLKRKAKAKAAKKPEACSKGGVPAKEVKVAKAKAAKEPGSGSRCGVPVQRMSEICGEIVEDAMYAAIRVRIETLEGGMKECRMGLHTAMCQVKGNLRRWVTEQRFCKTRGKEVRMWRETKPIVSL